MKITLEAGKRKDSIPAFLLTPAITVVVVAVAVMRRRR